MANSPIFDTSPSGIPPEEQPGPPLVAAYQSDEERRGSNGSTGNSSGSGNSNGEASSVSGNSMSGNEMDAPRHSNETSPTTTTKSAAEYMMTEEKKNDSDMDLKSRNNNPPASIDRPFKESECDEQQQQQQQQQQHQQQQQQQQQRNDGSEAAPPFDSHQQQHDAVPQTDTTNVTFAGTTKPAATIKRHDSDEDYERNEEEEEEAEEELADRQPKARIVEKSPKGRYMRFNERLGEGAFKRVYRAYDAKQGVEVAWNTVKVRALKGEGGKRILQEMKILQTLDHPNIIQFYGSWLDKESQTVVFVTELVSGGTLNDFFQQRPVVVRILKRWCRHLLKSLCYLHGHNPPIIHRDLKCSNIFINLASGDIRIADLGLASWEREGDAKSILGTPEYMAPELYDEQYDEQVDIYAFGMCVLEMVTKLHPYSECTSAFQIMRRVTDGIPPQAYTDLVDGQLKDFIHQCIVKREAGQRRPSAKELLNDPFLQKREGNDAAGEADGDADNTDCVNFIKPDSSLWSLISPGAPPPQQAIAPTATMAKTAVAAVVGATVQDQVSQDINAPSGSPSPTTANTTEACVRIVPEPSTSPTPATAIAQPTPANTTATSAQVPAAAGTPGVTPGVSPPPQALSPPVVVLAPVAKEGTAQKLVSPTGSEAAFGVEVHFKEDVIVKRCESSESLHSMSESGGSSSQRRSWQLSAQPSGTNPDVIHVDMRASHEGKCTEIEFDFNMRKESATDTAADLVRTLGFPEDKIEVIKDQLVTLSLHKTSSISACSTATLATTRRVSNEKVVGANRHRASSRIAELAAVLKANAAGGVGAALKTGAGGVGVVEGGNVSDGEIVVVGAMVAKAGADAATADDRGAGGGEEEEGDNKSVIGGGDTAAVAVPTTSLLVSTQDVDSCEALIASLERKMSESLAQQRAVIEAIMLVKQTLMSSPTPTPAASPGPPPSQATGDVATVVDAFGVGDVTQTYATTTTLTGSNTNTFALPQTRTDEPTYVSPVAVMGTSGSATTSPSSSRPPSRPSLSRYSSGSSSAGAGVLISAAAALAQAATALSSTTSGSSSSLVGGSNGSSAPAVTVSGTAAVSGLVEKVYSVPPVVPVVDDATVEPKTKEQLRQEAMDKSMAERKRVKQLQKEQARVLEKEVEAQLFGGLPSGGGPPPKQPQQPQQPPPFQRSSNSTGNLAGAAGDAGIQQQMQQQQQQQQQGQQQPGIRRAASHNALNSNGHVVGSMESNTNNGLQFPQQQQQQPQQQQYHQQQQQQQPQQQQQFHQHQQYLQHLQQQQHNQQNQQQQQQQQYLQHLQQQQQNQQQQNQQQQQQNRQQHSQH